MRINKMITKRKMFFNLFFKEMHGGQFGEFVSGCWDLKN